MLKIIIFVTLLGEATPLPTSTSTTTILFNENELIRINESESEEGIIKSYNYKHIVKKLDLTLQDDVLTERPLVKTGGWTDVGLDMSEKVETIEVSDSNLHRKISWGATSTDDTYFELDGNLKIYEYLPFLYHGEKWYMFETMKILLRDHVTSTTSLEKFEMANSDEIKLFHEVKKKFGDKVD